MRRSKFSGVYSFAAPRAGRRRKAYYFVWELPDEAFAVQELSAAFQPLSEVEYIKAKTFFSNFQPEPSILAMPVVTPDLKHFETAPRRATTSPQQSPASIAPPVQKDFQTTHMAPDVPESALSPSLAGKAPVVTFSGDQPETVSVQTRRAYDLEGTRKARVVESRLRESFRQALLRLKRPRERKAAHLALEQLAQTTEGIAPSHKHMFRDFGVRLRQNAHPDLALLFSRKAVELSPEDDHAHFNLARILCALGKYDEAAAHISVAMNVDGEEPHYPRLLAYIQELKQKRGALRPTRSN